MLGAIVTCTLSVRAALSSLLTAAGAGRRSLELNNFSPSQAPASLPSKPPIAPPTAVPTPGKTSVPIAAPAEAPAQAPLAEVSPAPTALASPLRTPCTTSIAVSTYFSGPRRRAADDSSLLIAPHKPGAGILIERWAGAGRRSRLIG